MEVVWGVGELLLAISLLMVTVLMAVTSDGNLQTMSMP